MGTELTIVKELASLNATLSELAAIVRIVNGEIRNPGFGGPFNQMIARLAASYDVVSTNLRPLATLDSETAFTAEFEARFEAYKACYLTEISKPRRYADDAYEDYLVLKTMKENQTRFPLLKRSFVRLDQFVEKWVTNDAWLAMSIDTLFKMLQRLLNEIGELKHKDPEDAYLIFSAALGELTPYLKLLETQRAQLDVLLASNAADPGAAVSR